jgi:hypothetical protein
MFMPHELTFRTYLDAFTGGLGDALAALNAPDVEPNWESLRYNIDEMRTMVGRMNTATVQRNAAERGEKIPSSEQLTQAVQELTLALHAVAKHHRKTATKALQAALQLLTV